MERQALETGICPVREDLYTQAFGEVENENYNGLVVHLTVALIANHAVFGKLTGELMKRTRLTNPLVLESDLCNRPFHYRRCVR